MSNFFIYCKSIHSIDLKEGKSSASEWVAGLIQLSISVISDVTIMYTDVDNPAKARRFFRKISHLSGKNSQIPQNREKKIWLYRNSKTVVQVHTAVFFQFTS